MAELGKHVVVIAADESQHTENAIDWYAESIHRDDFRVLVVSVLEITQVFIDELEDTNVDVWQSMRDRAEAVKAKYLKQLTRKGVLDVEAKIIQGGRAGEVIVKEAEDSGAILVVLGTRGQGTVRRTILGSVSQYVSQHAHCPVVVYRG